MAIKVGGTEVVSDARQLSNIASVDATTVASLSAAGVGGGSTRDFTATGAITAGDIVSLLSDGTVGSTSSTTEGSLQTATGGSTYPRYGSISVKNNVVAISYRDENNSAYATLIIGTISGSTVTFGTPVVMLSESTYFGGVHLISDGSWGLINTVGASRYVVKRFTISGTTPTAAQEIEVEAVAAAMQGKFISDSTFMIAKQNDILKAITWDGSSLSMGSSVDPTTRNMNSYFNIVRYSDTEGIIAISDTNEDIRLASFTVSGTTTTMGIRDFLLSNSGSSSATDIIGLAPMATSGDFIAIQSDGNSSVRSFFLSTFSYDGSNFTSYGAAKKIPDLSTSVVGANMTGLQHLGNDVFAMSTGEGGLNFINIITIRNGTPYLVETVESDAAPASYDLSFPYSGADQIQLNSDGTMYIGTSCGTPNKPSIITFNYNEANPFAWVGMAEATVADGETVTCTTLGGTNSSRTGLTIGSDVFTSTYKVGTALSATEVLITGADK